MVNLFFPQKKEKHCLSYFLICLLNFHFSSVSSSKCLNFLLDFMFCLFSVTFSFFLQFYVLNEKLKFDLIKSF